jgi:isopentenyldiphosphate isomerase
MLGFAPCLRPSARRIPTPGTFRALRIVSLTPSAPPPAAAEECFDVLTAAGGRTGVAAPRSTVHRDGLWHRSTHIWVVSRRARAVLLQKRSAEKDTFPGKWDVSAAGHVSAGAESAETARRELAEELGLRGDVRFMFTAQAEAAGVAGGVPFLDRELQDVYVYAAGSVAVADVALQVEEVEEVRYWSVDEYRAALESGDERFVPRSPVYCAKLFPWFDKHMPARGAAS